MNLQPLLLDSPSRALLGMMAKKANQWPGQPDEAWVELSARFVGRGLGIPKTTSHRLLKKVMSTLDVSGMKWKSALEQGLDIRGERKGPFFGTVWKMPRTLLTHLENLLESGIIDWNPPDTSRSWWVVEGLDPTKSSVTCWTPHPHVSTPKPRCAWTKHKDGTFHFTCQISQDGDGRKMSFFGRAREDGKIEASMTHRAIASYGLGGSDLASGFLEYDDVIHSRRSLGLPVSKADEFRADQSRSPRFISRPPAPFFGQKKGSTHWESEVLCPIGTDQSNYSVEKISRRKGMRVFAKAAHAVVRTVVRGEATPRVSGQAKPSKDPLTGFPVWIKRPPRISGAASLDDLDPSPT